MIEIIAIFALLIGLGNALFTVYLVRKNSNTTVETLNGLNQKLMEGLEQIETELDPIIKANSRAMGAISSLSNSTKMDNALERRLGQDMMDQAIGKYGDVFELVKVAFPRVAEYIEENPEAMTKLIPRLNTLLSDPEARKRLNFNGATKSSNLSRIWGEERD